MTMVKCVIYLRVSTMEQVTHGVSLSAQESRLLDYCQLQELNPVRSFIEQGVSATKPLELRPEGGKMLQYVKRQKVKHIVVLKLDRMFRNVEDALRQTKSFDNAGITLHLVDMGGQSICTSSAIGRIIFTLLASFAQFERDLISERTAMALSHKRSKNEITNHPPYGFQRQGETLVVDPEEQKVVRSIRKWRDKGETLQEIADRLNQRQVPTKLPGGHWFPSTVKNTLKNNLHKVIP